MWNLAMSKGWYVFFTTLELLSILREEVRMVNRFSNDLAGIMFWGGDPQLYHNPPLPFPPGYIFLQPLNPSYCCLWLIIVFHNLLTLGSWFLVVDEWLKISDNPYLSTCLHNVAAQHLSKVEAMAIDCTSLLFYQSINDKHWQALKSDWLILSLWDWLMVDYRFSQPLNSCFMMSGGGQLVENLR